VAGDQELSRLLRARGLVDDETLRSALALRGPGKPLAEVLVEQGWLDPAALAGLEGRLVAVACSACGARAEVGPERLAALAGRCPRCGGALRTEGEPGDARESSALVRSGSGSRSGSRSSRERPDSDPPPERRCGRYVLQEELGAGAYGVVYRARDPRHERDVAVKVLTSTSPRARQRFEREIRATARLQHPGIVPLLDSGQEGEHLYLVMELVRGRPLVELAEARGRDRLGVEAAAAAVRDAARAIDYAHGEGVLHRDVKPHNVLLDEQGHARLVDFGLAQLEDKHTQLTKTGSALGTPAYMPPEQARSDGAVDVRSDVYALGATLYHALTGRPPFEAESGPELLLAVFRHDPEPPGEVDRRVPADLGTVGLKCLEKVPSRRYATAGALADDLDRWLRGEPIQARPVGPAGRLLRWVRRNRARVASAAIVGAVALASTGLLVDAWLERRRRDAARWQADADRAAVAAAAAAEEAADRRRAAERAARVEDLLDDATARPLDFDLEAARTEVSRYAEPETVATLAGRLREVAGALRAVEEAAYRAARDPDEDERYAGLAPITGLEAAIAERRERPLGAALSPDARRAFDEAGERIRNRSYRRLSADARRQGPDLLDLIGNAQAREVGEGPLLAAKLCCEALGRLGIREGATPALGEYLKYEAEQLRAVPAGRALCRLGGSEALALVEAALERYGADGIFAAEVRPALQRAR